MQILISYFSLSVSCLKTLTRNNSMVGPTCLIAANRVLLPLTEKHYNKTTLEE